MKYLIILFMAGLIASCGGNKSAKDKLIINLEDIIEEDGYGDGVTCTPNSPALNTSNASIAHPSDASLKILKLLEKGVPTFVRNKSLLFSKAISGNKIYFIATTDQGLEALVLDKSTSEVTRLGQTYNYVFSFWHEYIGDKIYFIAGDSSAETDLWEIDTTTDTVQEIAAPANTEISNVEEAKSEIGGVLYLVGRELSQRKLMKYTPGGAIELVSNLSGTVGSMTAFEGELYFSIETGGSRGLYKYDPVLDSVSPLAAGPGTNFKIEGVLTEYENELYFSGENDEIDDALFKYNSSTDTISLVADATTQSSGGNFRFLTVFNNRLYFNTSDGYQADIGNELWRLNDNKNGVVLVEDLFQGKRPDGIYPNSSGVSNLIVSGGHLYFKAGTTEGPKIFKMNSAENVESLTELHGGFGELLGAEDNILYFSQGRVSYLSSYNTTSNELNCDQYGASNIISKNYVSDMIDVGGDLYFPASIYGRGRELFKIDGTSNKVSLVLELNPGPNDGVTSLIGYENGNIYFTGGDGVKVPGIWKYNVSSGTATQLVSDKYNQQVYFGNGVFLYGSDDHREDGEFEIIAFDSNSSSIKTLNHPLWSVEEALTVGNTIYFIGESKTEGEELFKLNTTNFTVELAADLTPGSSGSSFSSGDLVLDGIYIYFGADVGATGRELWRYNTSTDSAELVLDYITGSGGVYPAYLSKNIDGDIYFSGVDSSNGFGRELWKYNIASNSMTFISDVATGSQSSTANSMTAFDNKIYFRAKGVDPLDGVWIYDPSLDITTVLSTSVRGPYIPNGVRPPVKSGSKLYIPLDDQLIVVD